MTVRQRRSIAFVLRPLRDREEQRHDKSKLTLRRRAGTFEDEYRLRDALPSHVPLVIA
jgi:hypothetical protein